VSWHSQFGLVVEKSEFESFFGGHFTPLSLCRKKFFFQKTLYDARNRFSVYRENFWCKFEVKILKIE
jgi:hypothetical protein